MSAFAVAESRLPIAESPLLSVAVGGVAHFVLMIACLDALVHSGDERKWRKFVLGGVLAVAFAAVVAIARPR